MVTLKSIREAILKERGLAVAQKQKQSKRQFVPRQVIPKHYKPTTQMKYLENKYGNGQSIFDIILSGSLSVVCDRLGNEVDRSTVSKWIKRYHLRYGKTNLPDCAICSHYLSIQCDQGTCNLLIQTEQWELVLLKKKELLAGNTTSEIRT